MGLIRDVSQMSADPRCIHPGVEDSSRGCGERVSLRGRLQAPWIVCLPGGAVDVDVESKTDSFCSSAVGFTGTDASTYLNWIGGICLKQRVSGREVGSSHHAVLIERGHSKEPLGLVDCHGVTIT